MAKSKGRRPSEKERGRPRRIESPEEFNRLVDEYVQSCLDSEAPVTWTGMALALGFYGRAELDNYATYEGFSQPVKRAKTLVECAYEHRLHGQNAAGAIFALKNMGWSDKQEMEHTGSIEFTFEIDE